LRRRRVIVLCHEALVPPARLAGLAQGERDALRSEWDVAAGLRSAGHEVRFVGVSDDLEPIRRCVRTWRPHAAFNLLMEFRDEGALQPHVAAYLELLGFPTGPDARALRSHRQGPLEADPAPDGLDPPRGPPARGARGSGPALPRIAVARGGLLGIAQARSACGNASPSCTARRTDAIVGASRP
jgi:hypothetical protein